MLSRARRRALSAWVGLGALALGCAGAGSTSTLETAAVPSAADAATAAGGIHRAASSGASAVGTGPGSATTASAEPAASAAAATGPSPLTPFEPHAVRCGSSTCKAGGETCCWFGKDSGCAPTAAGNREPDLLKQSQLCMDRVRSEVALSGVTRCDDAADCGPKETCCRVEPLGGVELSLCTPFAPGKSACDLGERCVPEVACKTPGTSCVEGHCRLAGRPECMGNRCEASAPVCCGKFDWQGKPSCRAVSECATGANVYECFKPSDCPKGEICQSQMTGTRCLGKLAVSGRMVVCEKDADCPKGMCPARPSPGEEDRPAKSGAPKAQPDKDKERGATCAPNQRDAWSNLMTCQCPGTETVE